MKQAVLAALATLVVAGGTVGFAHAEESATELTEAQIEEATGFILNNALFVGMHEAGHMLISEFGLPVLGREEDAVDNLAAVIMLEADTDELDQALQDAADGWFLLAEGSDTVSDAELQDEHSLNEQRAFNIVCMMTGADPEVFATFADSLHYPEERRERCYDEYLSVRESWAALLEPHVLGEGEPSSEIEVFYEKPEADYEIVATILKEGQLLETLVDVTGGFYRLEQGIRFVARNCGEENAYWDPDNREMTFCYEFANLHAAVIVEYLEREKAGN